jgi:hypothetical protein
MRATNPLAGIGAVLMMAVLLVAESVVAAWLLARGLSDVGWRPPTAGVIFVLAVGGAAMVGLANNYWASSARALEEAWHHYPNNALFRALRVPPPQAWPRGRTAVANWLAVTMVAVAVGTSLALMARS